METMKQQLKAADFKNNVTKMIGCYCDLMSNVDVSLFSQAIPIGGEEGHRRTSVALQVTKPQGSLIINQESDIA